MPGLFSWQCQTCAVGYGIQRAKCLYVSRHARRASRARSPLGLGNPDPSSAAGADRVQRVAPFEKEILRFFSRFFREKNLTVGKHCIDTAQCIDAVIGTNLNDVVGFWCAKYPTNVFQCIGLHVPTHCTRSYEDLAGYLGL